MSDQNHVYEVDLIVRANGQPDYRISREYVSPEKCSTDGAAGEIFQGIRDDLRAKMRPVNDAG